MSRWRVVDAHSKWSHTMVMKTMGAAEFKARCLQLMDEVGPEGILITKRGKPVAKLVPAEESSGMGRFFGIYPDLLADPDDDLSTAHAWKDYDPGRGLAAL